jgi:hypothetical protein
MGFCAIASNPLSHGAFQGFSGLRLGVIFSGARKPPA